MSDELPDGVYLMDEENSYHKAIARDNEPAWTTQDGKQIPYSQLTDSHLANILRMMKRFIDSYPGEQFYMGDSDMAEELYKKLPDPYKDIFKPTENKSSSNSNKTATKQIVKYKGTNHGWYCDSCYQEGLDEEKEAMYG